MKKHKIIIFTSLLVVVALVSVLIADYEFDISNQKYRIGNNVEEYQNTYQETIKDIIFGTKIEQLFTAKYNNLSKVDIVFDPLKEKDNVGGTAIIQLIEKDTLNVIANKKILYNDIRENSKYKFQFDKQKQSEGKQYILSIEYIIDENEVASNAFSLKYSNKNIYENTELSINNQKIEGNLAFSDYYVSTNRLLLFYIAATFMSIVMISISIFIYTRKEITVEKAFLYTVPLICILFLIFMPPIKNHDELYHWFRAYDIAEGHLLAGLPNDNVPFISAKIPNGAISVLGNNAWLDFRYANIVELLNEKMDLKEKGYTEIATSAVYSPIQYIPQAIGIIVSEIFLKSPILITYGARIFNMIFSLAILYYAIKLMPFGKKIFLMLCYIPIAIEGFSSMSPDAITISISMLFIAYIFHLAFNENTKVGKKQVIIISILSIIIALCKIVYLPLAALILIIPKEKFGGLKNKIIISSIVLLVSTIFNFIWLGIASRYLLEFRNGDSKYQVLNILMHPIEYMKILLYTINKEGYFYFDTLFGGQLGWAGIVKLNFIVPFLLFVMYLVVAIEDKTVKNKLNSFQKIIIFLICLAIIALIFTSLYVQWTYVGNESILGVQGRYFLPFLPLIFILISGVKIRSDYKELDVIKFTSITGLMLQLFVMLELIIANV